MIEVDFKWMYRQVKCGGASASYLGDWSNGWADRRELTRRDSNITISNLTPGINSTLSVDNAPQHYEVCF